MPDSTPARALALPAALVLLLTSATILAGQDGAPDPLDHFRQRQEAVRAYEAGRWEEAAAALAELVAAQPGDSELWYHLARSRQRLDRDEGAIRAYREAWRLGYRFGARIPLETARLYAGLDAPDSTYAWLDRALAARMGDRSGLLSDPAFAALRDEAAFRERAGALPPEAMTRDEGWRHDLRYLRAEVRRMHVSAPGRPAVPAAFDSVAAELLEGISERSDTEMLVGLQRLMTTLGDGHTGIYFPAPDSPLEFESGSLPLLFYAFDDGLYVRDAAPGHERWIGSRVLAFGPVPAEEAVERLGTYTHHDNPMTVRWLGVRFTLPGFAYLRAIGAVDATGPATITLRDSEGAVHRPTFRPGQAFTRDFRRKLRPAPTRDGPPPLYLRQVDRNYWMTPLPDRDALYFQFNQVRDLEDGPTLSQFADSLRTTLEASGASALIVDVRHNNGGNNGLLRPLVRTLVWWEQVRPENRIFVITGRNTFSAAQNFINRVERWTNAVFVGEPSSSSPNFTGEETGLVLPYSRVLGSISNLHWQDSDPDDRRPWIVPDIPVQLTSRDYFQGRDPALTAILELLDPNS